MTYDQAKDSRESYNFAHHMIRLRKGLRRFETVWEMYLLEQWGEVP